MTVRSTVAKYCVSQYHTKIQSYLSSSAAGKPADRGVTLPNDLLSPLHSLLALCWHITAESHAPTAHPGLGLYFMSSGRQNLPGWLRLSKPIIYLFGDSSALDKFNQLNQALLGEFSAGSLLGASWAFLRSSAQHQDWSDQPTPFASEEALSQSSQFVSPSILAL